MMMMRKRKTCERRIIYPIRDVPIHTNCRNYNKMIHTINSLELL